ncbi:MAG: Peptidoglycan glycosyltransferase MrdB [Flavobacteriia bacterium]|nr:MAG: Peptidoglycan glycosyltransferase MrdB [Flavobacteriia bacterium]
MREGQGLFWKLDGISIGLFLLLVFLGWMNIHSAAYQPENEKFWSMDSEYGKQLLWIGSSMFILLFILLLDGRVYERIAYPVYALSLLALAGVLIFGSTISGARSWYTFGGFSLQPSEFVKCSTALALAKLFSKESSKDGMGARSRWLAFALIALPILLILPQPDLGSALVFLAFLFVLYREGMSITVLLGPIGIGILFVLTLLLNKVWVILGMVVLALGMAYSSRRRPRFWLRPLLMAIMGLGVVLSVDYAFNEVLEDRHRNRIDILLGKAEDPKGIGYNTQQSLIAIGSGGLSGKGFLQGTQTRYDFVPEQTTDFIFCTVGEEWGFLGSSLVVLLFTALLFRLIFLAERQKSRFSRAYGYGVAAILFLHFAVNIAMTVGLAPVIGIPLPFFSYGGSSLWGFTLLLFIFLRLDAYRVLIL